MASTPSQPYSNRDLRLVDSEPEAAFDSLTRLASRIFSAPVALVSIVEEVNDRQYFKSLLGLPEPWASNRQTPLSHSFCQYVKRTNAELAVSNAPENELVRTNKAIVDLNVVAYLGVPIHGQEGEPVGALCIIDHVPRDWSDEDVRVLADLASCATSEIKLRASLLKSEQLHASLETEYERVNRYTAMRESIAMAFMTPDISAEDRFRALLRSACQALGMASGTINKITDTEMTTVFSFDRSGDNAEGRRTRLHTSLSGLVVRGQQIIAISDTTHERIEIGTEPFPDNVRSYLGVPLVYDGVLHGVIEFCSSLPRARRWSDDELSVVSIMAMIVASNLQLFGEIRRANRSEAAMLGQLIEFETRATFGQQSSA